MITNATMTRVSQHAFLYLSIIYQSIPNLNTPQAIFFDGRIPHPWGKKRVQNPHPRAYENEQKLHPWVHFPQLFTIKT